MLARTLPNDIIITYWEGSSHASISGRSLMEVITKIVFGAAVPSGDLS